MTTPKGRFAADYLICGTGGDMDVALRPELAAFSEHIATWADRYTPPQDKEGLLGRDPSLGSDYAFLAKTPGAARFLKDINCFGIGACVSYGMSGAPINAMYVAVSKLVAGVTRGQARASLGRPAGLRYEPGEVAQLSRLEDVVQDPIVVSVAERLHMREARGGIDRCMETLLLLFNSVVVFRQDDVQTLVILCGLRLEVGARCPLFRKEGTNCNIDGFRATRPQFEQKHAVDRPSHHRGRKNTRIPGPFLVAAF